jgi:RNA recognition motif-containing protein
VADSSLVWDRYLQLLQDDLDRHFSPEKVRRVAAVFTERLGHPHATWDSTLSMYSTFNSRYNQSNYEAIMEHAVSQNAHIKKTYALRQEFEFNLDKAVEAGDQAAEYYAMTRYLKWEKKTIGVSSFHIVNALYERAAIRFPVDPALWEDHVEFLIWQNNRSVSLLDVLERATRHCPWSGSLWSHRILTLEAEEKPYDEIERVKHTATNTGMLEHTDLEELIKLQIAWCGYLRRKAFDAPKATEDDADIAEIGIRSALEHAHTTGIKRYGQDWTGDPKYRLERIHIKFWTQRGHISEARQIWESLVPQQEDSYDFWYRYYIWEMVLWSNQAVRDKTNAGQPLLTPERATAVLEKGMKRLTTIDQPEPLLEMYVNHCEQHESVLKVRSAFIEQRRSTLIISVRRGKEAAQVAKQLESTTEGVKRKREDGADEDIVNKKSKQTGSSEPNPTVTSVEAPRNVSEAPSEHSTTQKRDREHASVIVRNLPADVTTHRLRQFFTDAGVVINITKKSEPESTTATIEFATPEEAEYAVALEPKASQFQSAQPVTIRRGESTTLYVTNYPAYADETYLRNLFCPYGEIINVRFPSLKFDAQRRFCYVQFSNENEAVAATALNGHDVEGLELLARISDPTAKKKREGPTEEGREVYVRKIPYTMKQDDIQELFAEFGTIEQIRMPTKDFGNVKGNNKGYCFVTFTNRADAEKAAQATNGKRVWGMNIQAEIAKPKGGMGPKIRSEVRNTATPDPTPDDAGTPNENRKTQADTDAPAPVSARTLALLNIPDTVNDARIAALVSAFNYKKITLMPQHAGAIIEFRDVASVGKAGLVLDGVEIAPGRKLTVGTVAELKQAKAEYRADKGFAAAKEEGKTKGAEKKEKGKAGAGTRPAYMQPTRVNRPAARGASTLRGRGKPGLGHRSRPANPDSEQNTVKSNADFRAMLLGKKTEANTGGAEKEATQATATNGEGDAEMVE